MEISDGKRSISTRWRPVKSVPAAGDCPLIVALHGGASRGKSQTNDIGQR